VAETLQEILTRFEGKIANSGGQDRAGQGTRPNPLPNRHPVRDFFITEILDWALKGDRHSMAHPMFSLSQTPDRQIRDYGHNGISVTISRTVRRTVYVLTEGTK
jgi:hypothetical protein